MADSENKSEREAPRSTTRRRFLTDWNVKLEERTIAARQKPKRDPNPTCVVITISIMSIYL